MSLDFDGYREATLESKRSSYDLATELVMSRYKLKESKETYEYLLNDWETLREVHKDVWESHDKMQKHLESLGVDVEALLNE